MSARAVRPLAEMLADRIAAVEGVRTIFPDSSASAVLDRVRAHGPAPRGLVRVDSSGPVLRISARLATARAVPADRIVAGAVAAIVAAIGDRPYVLDIEFSSID